MQKRLGSALAGAVATATIPAGFGVIDWKVLAGAAAAGAVGGFFGIDVAGVIKKRLPSNRRTRAKPIM